MDLTGAFDEVLTEAFLLRSVEYREADCIVTLLTSDLGKVSALARGARSSRRRFGGSLQPFVHFRARLKPSTTDLYNLVSIEPLHFFQGIQADLSRLQVAACGLMAVRELTPEGQSEPLLFVNLLRWLTWLEHRADPTRAALCAYVVHILGVVGSAPGLAACGRCGRRAPARRAATFDVRVGALVCHQCGGAAHLLSGRSRRFLISASNDWLSAAREALGDADVQQVRAVVADFVRYHETGALDACLRPVGG